MECIVSKGKIYYESYGEGYPIIILHGMGTDHRSMKAWIEPILNDQKGIRRVYIDIPVHGNSIINEGVKSSDDILSNLLEFIDTIIPNQSFSLIGFSYGGYLAQGIMHYKLKYVQSICLIASALHLKERSLPAKTREHVDEESLDSLDSDIRIAIETLMVYQNKSNIETFIKEIQPGRTLANRTFLASNWREKGYFLREDPLGELNELHQPALLIMGRQDHICGFEDHLSLYKKFKKGSLAILDEAGHLVYLEQREQVQSLVMDWLLRTKHFIDAGGINDNEDCERRQPQCTLP